MRFLDLNICMLRAAVRGEEQEARRLKRQCDAVLMQPALFEAQFYQETSLETWEQRAARLAERAALSSQLAQQIADRAA